MVAISLIYAIAWWIQNETRDLVSLSWIKNKKSFLYNILPIALKAGILRLRISGWIWCSCYILVVIYSSTFICTFQGRNHFLSRVLFFWLKGVVNFIVYFSIFCSFANFSNGFFENYFFFLDRLLLFELVCYTRGNNGGFACSSSHNNEYVK